ncbi:TetR/AcrR family transcriptional regulator [Paraherbaspirillum soli]|uniref:TetR/AcrR family transcriptional regulator n=1 Tax=Paraherbaspirillum soli TaxID=631222 RepID=A0ABW0MEP8_9BURK
MRYAKHHKSETRRDIVETASRRFREEGVDTVGIASLMADIGLTAGGFYAHFESKEALVAEACNDGLAITIAQLREYVNYHPPGQRLSALADAYLSPRHRDAPGYGCVIAANGAEIARRPPETRALFASQLNEWIALIGEILQEDGLSANPASIVSAMTGSMILARSVDDPVLSASFLESGLRAVQACIATNQT